MRELRPPDRAVAPVCRWRTAGETLDVIEALERIEALLARLDERLRLLTSPDAAHEEAPR